MRDSSQQIGIAAAELIPCPDDPSQGWFVDYGVTVYRYLRFQLPSADEAEDLTAETFLRVVRAAEQFDPERAKARTWILSIARNVLRDYQRAQKVRRHVGLGALRDLTNNAPSVEERLIWEEQVGLLLAAIATLSATDRELLSLRYSTELSTSEIGAILGIHEVAVRTRGWRLLSRLRKAIAALNGDP